MLDRSMDVDVEKVGISYPDSVRDMKGRNRGGNAYFERHLDVARLMPTKVEEISASSEQVAECERDSKNKTILTMNKAIPSNELAPMIASIRHDKFDI